MSLFHKLDDFLIDRVHQPIAHKIQRTVGITNFKLSKELYKGSAISFSLAILLMEGNILVRILYICIILFLIYLIILRVEYIEKSHKQGTVNESRIIERFARGYMLTLFTCVAIPTEIMAHLYVKDHSTWASVFLISFWLLYISGQYFLACTPLPPAQSWARQKWNNFLTGLNDALAPKPEPIRA